MTKLYLRIGFAFVIGILACSGSFAQKRKVDTAVADKYVVSAKAGGVNYATGTVTVFRVHGTSGQLLKGDNVGIGDRIATGTDGRAEVLLNPGSYVRVGPNSNFEFKSTDLEDLKIKLDKGSAMFEVFAADDFTVSILTPRGNAVLVDSGVYRIDVDADGTSTIFVTEGKAKVGLAKPVKGGRMAPIGVAYATAVKFDRGKRDELAEWSKTRAKDLAKMTSSLRNDNVRASLLSSFYSGRWGLYNSFGVWVFNPFSSSYCFLPFGYDWYSPYGHSYRHGLYWYNLPPVIYTPPIYTGPTTVHKTLRLPTDTPPYISLERESGREMRNPVGVDLDDFSTPGPRFPSSSPTSVPTSAPVYVPKTIAAPPAAVDKP